ncbi:hypothetical protein Tco_1248850 [Tanacetum coccineum]
MPRILIPLRPILGVLQHLLLYHGESLAVVNRHEDWKSFVMLNIEQVKLYAFVSITCPRDPYSAATHFGDVTVDEGNVSEPNNDLVDTIPEMFTDEHTLDYSSPPLYDDVDDDLVEP